MKPKYDVITIGGATEDIFFTVDDFVLINDTKDALHKKLLAFEYGSKIGVPEVLAAFGGGASNAAVSFARLGLRTSMLGAVGKDGRGLAIIANLLRHKIKNPILELISNAHSGVSFVLVNPGHDHIVFTHRGANDSFHLNPKQSKKLSKSLYVYVTSLSGNWKKTLTTIFDKAQSVAWNPGRQQIAAGLKTLAPFLRKTKVLICNKDEAIDLITSHQQINHSAKSLNDIKFLLREIKKYVPGYVVITNGEQGAVAMKDKKIYQQKIIKVKKVVDTTGVGDAFGSAFVAGLHLHKGDIESALLLAAKNAASVVSFNGAQKGLLRF